MKIIGICGGSCSGKSTVVTALANKITNLTVIHFDDYFIGKDKLEGLNITNFEDPKLYRLTDCENTLKNLKEGKSVTIEANSRESRHEGIKNRTIEPNDFVILEGFLIFYTPELRSYFDKMVFLDISEEEMVRRRYLRMENGGGSYSDEYIKKILVGEYRKNVRPQKQYADLVIDATQTPIEIIKQIESYILN